MKRDDNARFVRVGAFLITATVLLLAVVFVLGRTESLFARKARLHAAFENTNGLVVGAPVRLAGVDIGIVQSIRFDPDLKEKKVAVTLGVDRRYLDRIREDSIARLSSKGLLGDMIINITVGSVDKAPLVDGSPITAQETEGMSEVIESVQDGIGEVRALAGTVDKRLKAVLTDDVAHDVNRLARSTANVLEKVERGNGLVHALVYDPHMAGDLDAFLVEGRRVASDADRAIDRVDRVVAAVEKGNGTVHDLLYKNDGTKLLAEVQLAAQELGGVIAEIRTGKGLLHSLIYEQDRTDLIKNFTELSRILVDVGREVEEGKGTIGALLKDPTLYEDLKGILGNIKRNKLLRALVRYTIVEDDLKDTAPIKKQEKVKP